MPSRNDIASTPQNNLVKYFLRQRNTTDVIDKHRTTISTALTQYFCIKKLRVIATPSTKLKKLRHIGRKLKILFISFVFKYLL